MKFLKNPGLLVGFFLLQASACYSQSTNEKFVVPFQHSNGKFGYVNENHCWVIEPQFDNADYFFEDLASVTIGGKKGYIDRKGNFVINPRFDIAFFFSDGLAKVKIFNDEHTTYIDKFGNAIIRIPSRYWTEDFKNGFAVIKNRNLQTFDIIEAQFIDRKGNNIFNASFEMAHSFQNGFAAIKKNGKWGFIDHSGRIVINPQFERVGGFSEGVAGARIGGKCGFIDTRGNIVIQPIFGDLSTDCSDEFREGLAPVKFGGKWGFINHQGNFIINPQFERVFLGFYSGLASVKIDGKYGFIDKTGSFVIPAQFDSAYGFGYGLSKVSFGSGKTFQINRKGTVLLDPTCRVR